MEIFLVLEIGNILAAWWDSPIILMGSDKTLEKSIILGYNPARIGFVLRDLVPLSFFKQVMIVKVKMRIQAKCLIKFV